MTTEQSIDEIRLNFLPLEKKVKMRVLLSVLSLDQARRTALSVQLKKLLEAASTDTTDEVISYIHAHYKMLFSFAVDSNGSRFGTPQALRHERS